MKGLHVVALLLVNLRPVRLCVGEAQILICKEVPETFMPGYLSLLLWLDDAGEINSTALQSESLASVTRVVLDRAGVTGISSRAFASFQNLSRLSINDNALTQIDPSWFSRPAALTELSVMENQIEVLSGYMLSGLSNLTLLNLANNRIRTIEPSSFNFQTNLAELDLSGNMMTRVDPKVFRSLSFTRMKLDGNPWDCSCGMQDFVDFLKDLQSRFLLEREMKVTCNSPSSLRGVPVWNVSVCVTEPPWQPTPETLPSLSPGAPTLASTPGSPGAPTLASTATGSTGNGVSASDAGLVPTLIAVIVILSMLLFAVCFLALLYRRNRNSNAVASRSLKHDCGLTSAESPGHLEIRDLTESFHCDSEMEGRRHASAVRAKSAHAVLCTASVGVFDKDTGPSKETNMADVTEGKEELRDSSRRQRSVENAPSVPVNAETAAYLSIGASVCDPNANLTMQATNSPGQRSHIGKMGRISTWPLTALQWEMRRDMKAQEEAAGGQVMMVGSKVEPPAGADPDEHGRVTEDRRSQVESEGVCLKRLTEEQLSNPVDKTIESNLRHEPSKDQTQTEARREEQLNLNQEAMRDQPSPNRGLNPAANQQVSGRSSDGIAPKGPHGGSVFTAPSGGDEVPGCVDLLHEVVQNHGRWTRERWRRTHLSKQ